MPQTTGVDRVIGGKTYTVEYLAPRTQGRLALKLAKSIGPTILAIQSEKDVRDAMTAISEPLYDELVAAFEKKSTCDGVRLDGTIDAHFLGRFPEQLEWLAFCLMVNFFPSSSAYEGIKALVKAEAV